MAKIRPDDAGATAAQTTIVIVIICLLAYLALPVWARLVERAKAKSCQSNQRSITETIDMARTDGRAASFVGFYDGALDVGSPWGRLLIPAYLSKPPVCPAEGGGLYNVSPFGRIWSDKGAGQYTWVNQGMENDHHLKGQ